MDPAPLISPSKARQAASRAKDWAYINSWLNRKYSPNPVPHFERNEDTLKTLLTLAAANDAADDEEVLLHTAREETIRNLLAQEETTPDSPTELLDTLESSLDDKGAKFLDELAEAAVLLGTFTTSVNDLGHRIVDLTREEFDAADQLRKIELLQSYLDNELESLRTQMKELRNEEKYETPADLPVQTADWVRGTKILGVKIDEYHNRISTFENIGKNNGLRIEDLMVEEESVVRLRETVKAVEGNVKMFYGLPPNVQEAKKELECIEKDYRNLVRQRDTMFENLVDHVK
ncbi:InfB (translation initiation factor) domain-containing protein [Histoplasma capsulatum]|uniref:InfB (Translation initiation factor) domain-containing protein n=1 Tax=Ajellomyces capsulatus TaxID=5037 RepID=A0A8A1MFH7_AJECA|nr:InfB (translation initiation factor) domain-containing protein [Histoplasma capsulatum]